MTNDTNPSRRNVLRGVAAGMVTSGLAGEGVAAKPTNRHIVGLQAGADVNIATSRAKSVSRVLDFGDIGTAVAGVFPKRKRGELRNKREVRYVEADSTYEALAQTLPWGVDRVDADVLHSNGETGNGADIAIIDTGIDDDHEDLQANVGAGKAYVNCSGSNCNYDWSDDNDHGTHCAGIADAVNNSTGVVGVSTEATLHAVKVLDSNGSGSLSDVAAGIEYVADQGWDVGSLSLGASSGDQTLKDACQYADDNGVLLVGAAGNDGPCSDCVGYPAAYSTVIAVSSTDSDDTLSSFSSTGPEVELAAPGGSIYSTIIGGYDTLSGTSMACPHVSGAGGQLMANGYTNTEARTRLQNTAEDIGLADNEQGHGLLDAEAAVLGGAGFAVSTNSPANVDGSSATLNGSVEDLDGASSADVYFEWRETGASAWNTTSVQTLSSTGSFSDDITNLSSGVEYEYRSVGEASDGDTDTGTTVTFTASDCVDATKWPDGTGSAGNEYVTTAEMDGQVVKSSSDNAYYDFSCPDVVTVTQGGSFTVSMEFEDAGYDSHYGNIYVDWDNNEDWSTATETRIMENVGDDTVTYSATVNVPSDAATGGTLARLRLSWGGFKGPSATNEYGEVNDFTVYVTDSESGPTVDSLSASEVETSNSDAEFDVDWSVSDTDGNLDSLDLALTDDTAGGSEDSATISVSGDTASGTTRLVAAGDDGSGNSYTVDTTVTDAKGNTGSGSTTVSESETNCVDATNWPYGDGSSGGEYATTMDMDGQVVKSSSDNAYYDFSCPDVVTVTQGGSFTVSMEFEDAGYDSHYGNIYVDWDNNEDWSTASETQIMENVSDDTVTYSATVNVPSDAATGGTLARVRLSWSSFYGPSATDEYGEVEDFTIYVE